MKNLIVSWLLSVLFIATGFAQYGTSRTGYEGDYFSLEGALDLFKQSHSLRDFERKLNTEENWVNNLDLNYDGRIDYIRVEHRRQRDFHAIILQALVDRYDVQDVAVIEIELTGRRSAMLQIIGDEDLYGEEVIVEPVEGYSDSRRRNNSGFNDYVNVFYWEPVQYLLGRSYQVYSSPYRWQYQPSWWRPWRQCSWNIFRPRIVIYRRHYHVVHVHRVIRVHNFYRNYRSYSTVVVQRANDVRVRQGRQPIYRPVRSAQQNRRDSDYRNRNDVTRQSRNTARSNAPGQNPSLSRKRTLPSAEQRAGRQEVSRSGQRSRSSINNSRPDRTTATSPRPSISNGQANRSSSPRANRSSAPQVKQPSRNRTSTRSTDAARQPSSSRRSTPSTQPKPSRRTTPSVRQPAQREATRSNASTRSGINTRSASPSRKPSASSRTAPSVKPKARSARPSVRQPARKEATRSNTSSRSRINSPKASPSRKPSASSRSSAPTSKSRASRSSGSQSSKSKSRSRSRSGG